MKRHSLISAVIVTGIAAATSMSAFAQTTSRTQTQTQTKERVYGSQLMTVQERNEYQQPRRELKTVEERNAFRDGHHAATKERAKERGVALPAEPPTRGKGAAPRDGVRPRARQGAGPGAGTGAGKVR